jgi:hypothetical protein
VTVALGLVYGKRPWTAGIDIFDYARSWLGHYGLLKSKDDKTTQKRPRSSVKAHKTEDSTPVENGTLKKRTSQRNRDEEYGIADEQ